MKNLKRILFTLCTLALLGSGGEAVSAPRKILIVVTNTDTLGETGEKTGAHLSEITHPYFTFREAGFRVDFVSPLGGNAPVSAESLDLSDQWNRQFWENPKLRNQLLDTASVDSIRASEYAGIFLAGGHGTMFDFPKSQGLQRLIREIYEQGGAVGAVCHGPAGLVNVKLSNGSYLVTGKEVSSFTNEEERLVGMVEHMPFLLETTFISRGARFTLKPPFQAHFVTSERLVTGQNPASAFGVAHGVVSLLK